MSDIKSRVKLNNEIEMPLFGLGVYLSEEGEQCIEAVDYALNEGYRLIDTASFYANEKSVGKAVRQSSILREEVFVTTKLWNSDHGYDEALFAFEKSLKKLDIDYIDLYLVHYPVPGIRPKTWKAMERIYDEGMCKSIGVSNYMSNHLQELLSVCNVPPVVNQIELSPFSYRARKATINTCLENNIVVQNYSPLTRGRKFDDPVVQELSIKYGKTPAQILLRWGLDRGFSVIPKSSNPGRISENASIFDFRLDTEEKKALEKSDEGFLVCWDPGETE
jgi:diketogulonate reductase-like aldo/keto reductase